MGNPKPVSFRAESESIKLIPHHCGTEEVENLADRIGDRARAAASEKETYCARVGGNVFDHQRTRVTTVEKLAPAVGDDNLPSESFGESSAACALVVVGHADGGVQARD